MKNIEEQLFDIVSFKNQITNGTEIPIEIIKNNINLLENLSETELMSIIHLMPDDILQSFDSSDYKEHVLIIAKICFYKSLDVIKKLNATFDEDEIGDYEFLLECSRDTESELLGRHYPDEGEDIEGITNFEVNDLSEEELRGIFKYDIIDEVVLYKMLSPQLQDQYYEMFINSGRKIYLPLLWLNTKNQSLDKFEKISNILDADYNYLMGTNYENKELIRYLFNQIVGHQNETIIELFVNTRKTNPDLIIPKELLDENFEFLNVEQLIRLSMTDKESRQQIVNLSKTNYGKEIVKYLCYHNEDYINSIGKFISHMDEYKELFDDIELSDRFQIEDEKNAFLFKLCSIIIGNSKNYFAIESVEDLDYFDESRQYEINRIFKKFNSLTVEDGQFAIIEAFFGIDRDEAERLVSRYGKYIDDLNIDKQSNNYYIKAYIETLRTILCLKKTDIAYLISDPSFIELINESNSFDLGISTNIEKAIRGLYSKEYQEKMLKLSDKYKLPSEIEYNGKKINVYEIPRKNENGEYEEIDFGLFARVEGAYGDFDSPKSYKEYFEKVDMNYHGNCESYINQSMNSFARVSEDGLIFFYTDSDNILMSAPWDMVSVFANKKFNTINSYSTNPVCFAAPDRMAETTRHLHNEFVFERYKYDIETSKIERRTPDIVGIQKEDSNLDVIAKIREGKYEEQLKAASDLDIPILIVNRKALAMQEFNRIKRDLKVLENYDNSNVKNERTFEEIMKSIIVRFECNAVGLKFHKSKETLFTSDARRQLIQSIVYTIKKGDEFAANNRYSYLHKILKAEVGKGNIYPRDYEGIVESLNSYNNELEAGIPVTSDEATIDELVHLEEKVPGSIKMTKSINRIQAAKNGIQYLKEVSQLRKEIELSDLQQEGNMVI